MAKLFIKKYGRDIRDDQDLAEDVADPPDEAANEVVHEVLTEEEQAFRADHLKTLRSRIGIGTGVIRRAPEGRQGEFKELFTGVLDGMLKPQRGRLNHFYSRKFYDMRIKPHEGTAERWELETPEFQRECEIAEQEREHDQAVAAWKASMADSPSRTQRNRVNAAYYLQPFVDAIQARFGMCAMVLLAGPIGIRGGRIGVQVCTLEQRRDLHRKLADFRLADAECQARAVASPDGEDVESSAGPAAAISSSGSAGNGGGGSVATGLVATGLTSAASPAGGASDGGFCIDAYTGGCPMGNGDDGDEDEEAHEPPPASKVSSHTTSIGSATTAPTGLPKWLAAVSDVTWVLEKVLASGEIGSHDADDTDGEEAPEKKRKRQGSGGAGKKKTAGKDKAGEIDAPTEEEAAEGSGNGRLGPTARH
ncbi:hypothetical protein B0H14DRAFT_3492276 [Mycena olivaceomarginata]|nr:hypothetical protein B0H14DRAFT_3492276 [Mycena olivaceomarginata]